MTYPAYCARAGVLPVMSSRSYWKGPAVLIGKGAGEVDIIITCGIGSRCLPKKTLRS